MEKNREEGTSLIKKTTQIRAKNRSFGNALADLKRATLVTQENHLRAFSKKKTDSI